MNARARTLVALPLLLAVPLAVAGAAGLRGSLSSMTQQHGVAREEGLAFVRTRAQLDRLVDEGVLARVPGNADYIVHDQVTHPYAQPEVLLLVERLAQQYRAATGRQLVVTSLVRPTAEQPGNAHRLSVHPAGMALDLRVPAVAADRAWLERALLGLENAGVLDVTREFRPPHYHVAVFPAPYRAYAERRQRAEAAEAARVAAELAARAAVAPAQRVATSAVADTAAASPGSRRDGTLALGVVLGVGALAVAGRRTLGAA